MMPVWTTYLYRGILIYIVRIGNTFDYIKKTYPMFSLEILSKTLEQQRKCALTIFDIISNEQLKKNIT